MKSKKHLEKHHSINKEVVKGMNQGGRPGKVKTRGTGAATKGTMSSNKLA